GTFQAVQQMVAVMAIELEGARHVTRQALWRLAEGLPAAREVAVAKAWTGRAYREATLTAHQLHGGAGYVIEHELHRYSARAKEAVTIDHLSGGRCELGIGAGWNEIEARAFGIPFPSIKERLDLLEETAKTLRALFDGERVTLAGRQLRLEDALCEPRPVQPRLRLWIGGQGEKRLLRLVARHADGWNVPFLAPEIFAQRNATLDRWCEREGRDPRAITRTANLGLALGRDEAQVRRQEESLRLMFGPMTDFVR